jgi:prepilin-type N-terminal cleavage/methylation domain-containing protein
MGRKNNSKRGFTLVELIVVLVILAVLAAILVPTLIGYIDKAKTANVIEETNQVRIAAQSLYAQAYADGHVIQSDTEDTKGKIVHTYNIQYDKTGFTFTYFANEIKKLAELKNGVVCGVVFDDKTSPGMVKAVQLLDGDNGCSYFNNSYYTKFVEGQDYPVPEKGEKDSLNSSFPNPKGAVNYIWIS